jgi:hypothetical protein
MQADMISAPLATALREKFEILQNTYHRQYQVNDVQQLLAEQPSTDIHDAL